MDKRATDIIRPMLHQMGELHQVLGVYGCGIREVQTKLEILAEEFRVSQDRSPIDSIETRVKKASSIAFKLSARGLEVSLDSAVKNLDDLAGVRVVCPFVEDIYFVAGSLLAQDDVTLIEREDYIARPKPSGYRSLHLVVEVPVFFSDHKQPVRVEVQIRTIAMDFWACLEEEIRYKRDLSDSEAIGRELKECADIIAQTDVRMQEIHRRIKSQG